ncbi:MAG: hypothetical protein ACYC96_14775 [Fimbriimonadaceae bacterium]
MAAGLIGAGLYCASSSSAFAQVPSLDSLAGKWLSGPEIVNPPSVTGTMGALGCSKNLTGFRYCAFPPIAQGGEAADLLVDGSPVAAHSFRWFPYQAEREAIAPNGLKIQATTRLAAASPAVLIRLRVTNSTRHAVTSRFELRNDCGFRLCPGVWDWSNRGVNPADGFRHTLQAGFERIDDSKSATHAWITRLPPTPVNLKRGETKVYDIACTFAKPEAGAFDSDFAAAKARWQERWRDAFTPGNPTYPGNFPTLTTSNRKLKRVYYLALATMLAMERTCFPHSRRCFVTAGPEYGTTLEYFWDTALFANVYALLDPVALKENLSSWLTVDIHHHYAIDYLTGEGVGPWYSPNDYSLFTAFWKYCVTTGDTEFLARDRANFVTWANAWKGLVRPGEVLADFGENGNLLECSPAYVNMVPSLNAAHVGLMRKAALLVAGTQATQLRADAGRLAAAVLGQYVPGDGVWKTKHRDGTEVPNRHVYDYLTIGLSMTSDLSPRKRKEMTGFVNRELLADGWIRAMSLSDPNAAVSDRPDHGPKGSYAAWPAMAALTMAKFGQFRDMESLIERCEGATWQGPFPQGFELLQVPGTNRWIPRIARRGCDYNETSGAAFAETVINGLFGIDFDIRGNVVLADATVPRPVEAVLTNVRTKAGLRAFRCGKRGVAAVTVGRR